MGSITSIHEKNKGRKSRDTAPLCKFVLECLNASVAIP